MCPLVDNLILEQECFVLVQLRKSMAHELLSKHVNTWSQPLAIPCENVKVKLIYIHEVVDLVFLALCSVRILTKIDSDFAG